jgi:hypothetical protein
MTIVNSCKKFLVRLNAVVIQCFYEVEGHACVHGLVSSEAVSTALRSFVDIQSTDRQNVDIRIVDTKM